MLLVAVGIPRTLDQQLQRAVHAALALRQFGLDDGPAVRAKVTRQLTHLELPREAVLSPLLSLLEGPPDDPTWSTLEPSLRRQRAIEAIRQILQCESQVQPVIVVCEDLYWSDHETQVVLDRLVDGLTEVPLLLLVTARPEYRQAWGGQAAYTARQPSCCGGTSRRRTGSRARSVPTCGSSPKRGSRGR